MDARSARCKSCGAPVLWLKNAFTFKSAPIDAEPSPDGNIAIDETHYWVVPAKERASYPELRKNHFSTCRQAKEWGSR